MKFILFIFLCGFIISCQKQEASSSDAIQASAQVEKTEDCDDPLKKIEEEKKDPLEVSLGQNDGGCSVK